MRLLATFGLYHHVGRNSGWVLTAIVLLLQLSKRMSFHNWRQGDAGELSLGLSGVTCALLLQRLNLASMVAFAIRGRAAAPSGKSIEQAGGVLVDAVGAANQVAQFTRVRLELDAGENNNGLGGGGLLHGIIPFDAALAFQCSGPLVPLTFVRGFFLSLSLAASLVGCSPCVPFARIIPGALFPLMCFGFGL